jgi:hypothetical protein
MYAKPKTWWKRFIEPAVVELEIKLDVMKTNEPINRKEGKVAQANLEKANAKSFEKAIGILKNGVGGA